METPQAGIFEPQAAHHYFLEFDLRPNGREPAIRPALRALRDSGRAEARAVFGFSAQLWAHLRPDEVPAGLAAFRTVHGRGGQTAPATQRALWLWLSGAGADQMFAAAVAADAALHPAFERKLEQPGFHYLDSRDMTGFIDGTANPAGEEAREAALVPEGQPGAGGAHVLAMRWEHNLAAFNALPVAEQEQVIGRRKADSEELPAADKPPTAHISRVEIEENGKELAIFRRSVPYGTLECHGLYFLAFARDPHRFDAMLARMYGLAEDGLTDRLTDYTRPTSAGYYFAPTTEALARALA